MAFNIHISGPKIVMHHHKSTAEMLMTQFNSNKGLFGIDCSNGKEYTYSTLKHDVLAMATAFQKENFGYEDIVMVTDYGSYEGQVVMFAGLLIGATIGGLDYNLKEEHLATLIDESKPDVLFCSTSCINKITEILNRITHQPILKISTTFFDGFTSYTDIVASKYNSFVNPVKSMSKNRPCVLVYSSGSTGIPKAIYLSDEALKPTLVSYKFLTDEHIEYRTMNTSPLFWYSGVLAFMLGIHVGKPKLFFSVKPSAEQILISIDKFKPTNLMTSVAAANEMMNCQMTNGHKYNIDSLKTMLVSGFPLRSELQKSITKNLLQNRIPLKQSYGVTEQGIITQWPIESDINTVINGCVGRPGAGIKIKIVSTKTGECVGPNTEGEIYTKSASNMIGYAFDVKKTINAYEDDWFKTGDLGYYTNDCYLFVVGRIKELIIYKDYKIAPTDIETVLLSHPVVIDAGVTSRDGLLGDILVAVVKLKPGQHIEPDRLVSYVNDLVQDHEKLRGGIVFVTELPRSAAGKLNREELKKIVR